MTGEGLHSSGFDIKPCPFCGSTPSVQKWFGEMMVVCQDVLCPAQPNVKSKSTAIAVELWNKRPAEADNKS